MGDLKGFESVQLLDCTLRDGGYYTAWDFDDDTVSAYLSGIARLPVDTVEIGYCSPPKQGYYGKYYFLSPELARSVASKLRGTQSLAVMLDEKSIKPADVRRLLPPLQGSVDLVRIAVAPSRLAQAADLGAELADLGFRVGVNIMYLSRYWDSVAELGGLQQVASVSEIVALVDSYGSCTPSQVTEAIKQIRNVLPDTMAGFHGHDNLGLAVANSLAAASAGARVIDGTVTGMGRGPGNTRTEILAVLRSLAQNQSLDYGALETVVLPFDGLRKQHEWGTNLAYMASGAAALPQADVMEWLGKNRYSLSAIVQALHGDPVEGLESDSHPAVTPPSGISEVIVIGGGPSVGQQVTVLKEYAERTGAAIVHANYRHLGLISEFGVSQFLCLAGDVAARLPSARILGRLTSIVIPSGTRFRMPAGIDGAVDIRQAAPFAVPSHSASLGPVSDTAPLSLALATATSLNARSVVLIGFDGYEHATRAQQDLARESEELITAFAAANPSVKLSSATATMYELPTESLYSRLAGLA
ncbi:hypothetical protein [Demequina lutea]|uniref:4-hydroxy 2-oxovalerate aldolase n=1 Tax=Demequina lutea TaxID=431489 RepID=A0A7Z0CGI3_9MICO|nr:hypothetical protein [Demequina lutea]NYI40426.1 4-hydroxy 2-oxovalerate aldolase [Demequina lutea]